MIYGVSGVCEIDRLLTEEFAHVLQIRPDQVEAYIREKLGA